MSALWTAAIGASTGLLGVIAGFIAPRSRTLESQREDFKAVLQPLRDELTDLRDRVKTLEVQHANDVAQHYRDQRRIEILSDYVQDLLTFIRLHVQSPEPPPYPPEFSNEI